MPTYDLGGNDVIVTSISTGATGPGQTGTKITATGTELNLLAGVTGTVTGDITRLAEATRVVSQATASTAYNNANADQKTFVLNRATGATITLPSANAATLGCKFRVIVGTALTSNSGNNKYIIQVANASDFMRGTLIAPGDGGATNISFWNTTNSGTAATESDTITIPDVGSAGQGPSRVGDYFDFNCIATNVWQVSGVINQSGTEATPFSAAV